MTRSSAPARRHGLLGTVLWAAIVVGSIVLIAIGLRIALFWGYMPEPSQVRDLRTGSLYILAGSVANLVAAAWSALRDHPYWVTAMVAAPVILVGGSALVAPTSLLRHLAAAVAFPFAVGAAHWGLRYR
ncbi:hypothetical protein [Pseudarthrobacter sulfonivorans]|uniref:hypothetical protein n=1 Tax=Pseudarthrobacter sulfonivorans TaxID=121292 RepID=UPI0028630DF7|nr:hypothetical protein [Pseudarthrobacter sulfonivorans]MDR6416450.1 lipoprotein signal peptidase [Pseudarthrobacter sulfonivorans]